MVVAQRWQLVLSIAAGLLAVSALKRPMPYQPPLESADLAALRSSFITGACTSSTAFPAGHASSVCPCGGLFAELAPGVAGGQTALLTVRCWAWQVARQRTTCHTLWDGLQSAGRGSAATC